ncbi:hypothetical protein, partial [Loigolactobacillus coryniformis]
ISSLMFIWLRSTLPQFASYLSSFQTDPSKQTTMAYTFKNIQLQLAGTSIQPGDYNATITYSWTDGVN